jgi:cellulose synthase/poly-beta-1,6-N-acetylglucosamine synthase-like glycosyltransferase
VKHKPLQVIIANEHDIHMATTIFTDTPYSASHNYSIPILFIGLITLCCFVAAIFVIFPTSLSIYILATAAICIFTLPVAVKWLIILLCYWFKNPNKLSYPILPDEKLPIYSVLVPIYNETKIFPELKMYLENLIYPEDKIEIILLLEEDDTKTIETVKKHLRRSNPKNIIQLIVPPAEPRTKPKALNIGMNYINGEYFVIYDAEDRPEPDQLIKSASYFASLPQEVGALQAKLSYHNIHQNYFLTRLFGLEYEIWFNHFLPGLVALDLPVPLSGTSTHMRTKDIKKVGGWDAYNVTEDCDLGIRLSVMGYKTLILNSITYEEAVSKIPIWIKQRTRWMKGYFQTLIVWGRNPFDAYRHLGLRKTLGFYAIVGGQVFSALLHPACWLFFMLGLYQFSRSTHYIPNNVMNFLHFLTVTGFVLPITQASVTARVTKKNYMLVLFSIVHSFYWMFAAYAAFRAIWQLLFCPFKWEKTPHGYNR